MNTPGTQFVEGFSQPAFEQLQFLREYCGVLQDSYPAPDAVQQLYRSAQWLADSAAQGGLPLFAEIAAKVAHIFHYALNAQLQPDVGAALADFVSDAVALLESDLLLLSASGNEAVEDISLFKAKYPFAFQAAASQSAQPEASPEPTEEVTSAGEVAHLAAPAESSHAEALPPDDDVPEEIIEVFIPEAEEHIQTVTECLLALEMNPRPDVVHRLFRAMHTIKGSAAQVGLQRVARVAHRAEDLVGWLRDGALHPSTEIVDLCLESVDAIKRLLYRQWPDEQALQGSVGALLARVARLEPEEAGTESLAAKPSAGHECVAMGTGEAAAEAESCSSEIESLPLETAAATPPVADRAVEALPVAGQARELAVTPQSKSVRVPLDRLNRMMNAVGELVINRTRMLGRLGELERLAEVLSFSKARLIDKIGEFQERHEFTQLPQPQDAVGGAPPVLTVGFTLTARCADSNVPEFSELEMDRYDEFNILSRSLTEISADVTEVLTQLDRFVRHVDSDMDEFTKLAHRLQDEITQARMVPIGHLYTRLSRTARDAAKAVGKQVDLRLAGGETELDNGIIQHISDPLVHLIRNAVAHGIEATRERQERGKSESGQISVRAYHRGSQIFVEVEDDGGGIDYEKIRATVVAQGLVVADEAARLSERELLEFLFQPGFSTAGRKTELAGRGVGLDVVRANLSTLNGEIAVDTEKGVGTRFTLKVPLTLMITQALFLRCGQDVFAIPLTFVEEIRRLRADSIEEVSDKLFTRVRDAVIEVVRLDAQLGLAPVEPINGFYRLVVVNVGGRQAGLVVEEILRKDEIVFKGLSQFLRNLKLFPGATIAPDGSLVLLIDVNRLVAGDAQEQRSVLAASAASKAAAKTTEPSDAASREKVILLADDSISMRRFVSRMLEKAGYRVKLASDGLEALELALAGGCDLVITDLEMPRTNGYELLAHLRQSPVTSVLPVMVMTSRAGAKHREKALREGAADFLTKPVQEEQLVAAVARIVGPGTPALSPALLPAPEKSP